jgi:hypothetical protein
MDIWLASIALDAVPLPYQFRRSDSIGFLPLPLLPGSGDFLAGFCLAVGPSNNVSWIERFDSHAHNLPFRFQNSLRPCIDPELAN